MKISRLSSGKSSKTNNKGLSREVSPASGGGFIQELTRVNAARQVERLEELLRDIGSQGQLLVSSRALGVLKKYKDLVRAFMEEALSGTYKVKEDRSWDRLGRHKSLLLVERIDKELEELTQMVLAGEKDNLVLLAKLDEIRGMLCDLYT